MANYYNEISNMIEKTIYRLMIADKNGLGIGTKNTDLSFLDIIVIKKIGDEEYVSQFSISKSTDISRGDITSIIKKLVACGYVTKKKSVEDKRANILTLTEEGKRVRKKIVDYQKCSIDYILHDITLNEEKAILKFLAKASQRILIDD